MFLLQGPCHGRAQPAQAILEEIIGSPLLHALNRGLLGLRARHHDERNVQRMLLEQMPHLVANGGQRAMLDFN